MTRGEITGEYQRLNGADQSAFRRWLTVNTIAGAVAILALIALTAVYSGGGSGSISAQKEQTAVHAQAR
jgi:hypothetical protein